MTVIANHSSTHINVFFFLSKSKGKRYWVMVNLKCVFSSQKICQNRGITFVPTDWKGLISPFHPLLAFFLKLPSLPYFFVLFLFSSIFFSSFPFFLQMIAGGSPYGIAPDYWGHKFTLFSLCTKFSKDLGSCLSMCLLDLESLLELEPASS